ncbi:hypothetical protein BB559_000973 [Furculomyces boomerangus]|uniref:DNA/RNA-binding protein Kin17 WH-like domain-containing protein n=2 Tax=Harpellales TaxID=61421 RepID=A0A2T9Z3J6_9FUNG|nr:hypothetical protein BB559_000973 [Furculomyces boomerangus]PWA03826.1 hypothetical protein BB558_000007 [Smittium angustum]
MPRAEAGTPKAIANKMKAKGLQKLRWFCQMCEKQCRDENGFKCHTASPSHQRQMALFSDAPRKYIEAFSFEFKDEFLKLLSRRYGTKRVLANQVYQEIISDKNHLHMNSTKWNTLTGFVQYLGREGICIIDETERGWFIEWIDNTPAALARREAIQKKERAIMTDEEREKKLLAEQLEIAKSRTKDAETKMVYTELKRESLDKPIKLGLFNNQKSKLGILGGGIKKPEIKKTSVFSSKNRIQKSSQT